MKPRDIRRAAGRSLAWVAVTSGVSEPTAVRFELDPENEPKDPQKRAALRRTYETLAAQQRVVA